MLAFLQFRRNNGIQLVYSIYEFVHSERRIEQIRCERNDIRSTVGSSEFKPIVPELT